MPSAPPRPLPIFAPAGFTGATGSPRARLEALMREIAARVQPQIIPPQLHESGRVRGGFPVGGTAPSGGLGAPPQAATASAAPTAAPGSGVGPGRSPFGSRPATTTIQEQQTGALDTLSRATKLARNLGVLDNIGNVAQAVVGSGAGSHLAAAAQLAIQTGDIGPLLSAGQLGWQFGTPSAVPAGAELAGLTSAAFRPEVLAAVPGGAGVGTTTGGLAFSGASGLGVAPVPGGVTNVATGTGAASGGLLGSVGGLAAASPLLIAGPMFLMGLYSRFLRDPGRTVGNALFDVRDGNLSLREVGAKNVNRDVVRAFSMGGMSPVMQAVQDVGGQFTTEQLPGTFGQHSDYGPRGTYYVELPGMDRITGLRSPEEAARRYGLELARSGAINVPDMNAFEQALDNRFRNFSIGDWLQGGGIQQLASLDPQKYAGQSNDRARQLAEGLHGHFGATTPKGRYMPRDFASASLPFVEPRQGKPGLPPFFEGL